MRSWISAALSVYAESLVAGRRVLVVGSAHAGVAERLAQLGARAVHLFEPVTSGAQIDDRSVVVQPLPDGDFDVRDGAFDFAIVAELGELRDPAALLARLRRVLGGRGAALVATSRAGDDAYYALYDAVALQFASVVMLASVPFRGLAIAELGRAEGDVEVSVDTQLITHAAGPIGFAALVAQEDLHLASYALVELPAARDDDAVAAEEATSVAQIAEARLIADVQRTQLEQERTLRHAQEREVQRLAEALVSEKSARAAAERGSVSLEDLIVARERAAALESSLHVAEERAFSSRERVAAVECALRQRDEDVLVLTAEVDALRSPAPPSDDPRMLALIAEVGVLEAELARATSASDVARSERRSLAEAHAGELEALRAELQRAHAAPAAIESQLEEALAAHEDELTLLEDRLQERAVALREAERQLLLRERIAREIVAHLHAPAIAEAPSPSAALLEENAALTKKLDAAALAWARHESALEASAWKVSELESRLETARHAAPREAAEVAAPEVAPAPIAVAPPPAASGPLEEQIAALRQALAQEHAARVAAESGESLAHAQAQLARQAALLAQISGAQRDSEAGPR
jgi:hypothetical protein